MLTESVLLAKLTGSCLYVTSRKLQRLRGLLLIMLRPDTHERLHAG